MGLYSNPLDRCHPTKQNWTFSRQNLFTLSFCPNHDIFSSPFDRLEYLTIFVCNCSGWMGGNGRYILEKNPIFLVESLNKFLTSMSIQFCLLG